MLSPTLPATTQAGCGTSTGDIIVNPVALSSAGGVDPMTKRTRRIWSAGAYDKIAAGFRHEAEAFVARRAPDPRFRVLDVACGSGNLTIPVARYGADVTGLDLVPSLVALAADWAEREGLSIQLDVGDAERLPYSNAQFDLVLSMFGVMFAARPDRVLAELHRVTRPGGAVALANWTRDGFVGRLLALHVKHAPPPAGLPSPLLWGDEATIRERFSEKEWDLALSRRVLTFRFAMTPAGIAELFRGWYGPTVLAFEGLDEDRRALLAADLTEHWVRHHRVTENGTEVDSDYLEVVAVRR